MSDRLTDAEIEAIRERVENTMGKPMGEIVSHKDRAILLRAYDAVCRNAEFYEKECQELQRAWDFHHEMNDTQAARIRDLEAEVSRLNKLIVHHDDGSVVTQGSFNACVAVYTEARATIDRLKRERDEARAAGAREVIEWIEKLPQVLSTRLEIACGVWDHIRATYPRPAAKEEGR